MFTNNVVLGKAVHVLPGISGLRVKVPARVYADDVLVVPYLTLGQSGFTVIKSYFIWAQSN